MLVYLNEVGPTLCPFLHEQTGGKMLTCSEIEIVSSMGGAEPYFYRTSTFVYNPIILKKKQFRKVLY